MRRKKAFSAKVRSGFAQDNAQEKSISSKSAKRLRGGNQPTGLIPDPATLTLAQ